MPIQPGTRIGPYEILHSIGAGGMGEVYRARDTKLDRDVAVKVLPQSLAQDPDALARFEREAKSVAHLSHPNILGIFDFGKDGRTAYAVMELLDGETLRERLTAGRLSPRKVTDYAVQIAHGLAAAHDKGLVHRDVKPENLFITRDDRVKILDFGLAKPVEFGTATVTMPNGGGTAAGTILGTMGYMAPEQVRGRAVDHRSDIFAFGAVLYEMLSGRRAFGGDSPADTISAVLNTDPADLETEGGGITPALERIVRRCLEKSPDRRFQSAHDLAFALETLSSRGSGAITPPLPAPRRAYRTGPIIAMVLAMAAIAGAAFGGWWLGSRQAAPARSPMLRLDRLTADTGYTSDPAVTPNGSLLAYASDRFDGTNQDIWVQPVAGGDPIRVTTHPADDSWPSFSPDGSRIAFRSERDGGGIYITPALGRGGERLLVRDGHDPAFSPDGKWLLYRTGGRGVMTTGLFVIPVAGGEARQLFDSRPFGFAAWMPDSQHVLFLASPDGTTAKTDLYLGALDSSAGPPKPTGAADRLGRWRGLPFAFHDGRVYYTRPSASGVGGTIGSVELRDGEAVGPERLLFHTHESIRRAAMDGDGRIYFSTREANATIWSARVDGTRPARDLTPLTSTAAVDSSPSLSTDGRFLAFRSTRRGDVGVWLRDLSSGAETALPSPSATGRVAISPDGQSVAYNVSRKLVVVDTRGGLPRDLCRDCAASVWGWTPDGTHVLVNTPAPQKLVSVEVGSGRQQLLFEPPGVTAYLYLISPDQRWLAFSRWDGPDRAREVIAPFTPGRPLDPKTFIPATDGKFVDEENAWSADGRTLYFGSDRDGFRCLYALSFDPTAGRVVGDIMPILHMHATRRGIATGTPGRIDVAQGRLVFPVREVRGNVYALTPEQ